MQSNSPQYFCTTQWTMVFSARDPANSGNSAALENLCRVYWPPLYTFARRKGCSPDDSQDMVQGFFARILEKDYLQAVDRSKGKFRTFLLCAFSNFLHDEWDKENRKKRGGGTSTFSLDIDRAEEQYSIESQDASPDKLFDKSWAQVVVDSVLDRLRTEFAESGEIDRFNALQPSLMGDFQGDGYKALGAPLGLSEGGVKTVVRRMRLRFATLLREHIAATLADPADTENEMRHLLEALAPC
jgi:DNA-directed RNA polymerase specialized sigma24 family protein